MWNRESLGRWASRHICRHICILAVLTEVGSLTHCGWCHSLGWNPELHSKRKVMWVSSGTLHSLRDYQYDVTRCLKFLSPRLLQPDGRQPWTVSQTRPFSFKWLYIYISQQHTPLPCSSCTVLSWILPINISIMQSWLCLLCWFHLSLSIFLLC